MRIVLSVLFTLLFTFQWGWAQEQALPERFVLHKVKRQETLPQLARLYNITEDQLKQYNPLIDKVGLKRRMQLRIPVYPTQAPVEVAPQPTTISTVEYTVPPKATKWRIAYTYGISIAALEALNPQIKEGLQAGQVIRVPQKTPEKLSAVDTTYNYYTVKPKEGYYRIEKKLGIGKAILDSLNPGLSETGLLAGMVLKIPQDFTGDLYVEDALLVEKINLWDSIRQVQTPLKMAVLLPFKTKDLELDSIEKTKALLKRRNLHTIALDFYSGVLLAVDTLSKAGIPIELSAFDTQNDRGVVRTLMQDDVLAQQDLIIGPLIPSNFDQFSASPALKEVAKVAPLSALPVALRSRVYQSVTPEEVLRNRMYSYLLEHLSAEENIMIVADSLHRGVERQLKNMFPTATLFRPEPGGFLLPELVDSLVVDSLPNKIILESANFSLISSVSAQLSGQINDQQSVQLFTTFRGTAYENPDMSLGTLASLKFTFPSTYRPMYYQRGAMDEQYNKRFGNYPNKEAKRAYDVTVDMVLRSLFHDQKSPLTPMGVTEYTESLFDYIPDKNGSFTNQATVILQHEGLGVVPIKN